MSDPIFIYCPVCATPLAEKLLSGVARQACPACSFVHFLDPKVVAVVVVEYAGRVLLGRRNVEPAKGQWSFVGGYVDRGEPVEAAALREVREETNLEVRLTGLLGVYSTSGQPHIVIAYRAQPESEITGLAPQAAEVAELAFWAPDTVPALAFPPDAAIWRDWLRWRASER